MASRSAGRTPPPATSSRATSGNGVNLDPQAAGTLVEGNNIGTRLDRHNIPERHDTLEAPLAMPATVCGRAGGFTTIGGTTAGARNIISGNVRQRRQHRRPGQRHPGRGQLHRHRRDGTTGLGATPISATACESPERFTRSAGRRRRPQRHLGQRRQRRQHRNPAFGQPGRGQLHRDRRDRHARPWAMPATACGAPECSNNTIGGTIAGARNVISGNARQRGRIHRLRRATATWSRATSSAPT